MGYATILPYTPQPLSNAAKTVVTGTQADIDFAGQIIGKDIPIFVGGQALIGCRIAEGAFITSIDGAGYCDMIVTAAVAATPSASRTITSMNLNGVPSWTLAGGFIGTAFSGMTVSFLYGTEDQTPFASSISRYGAKAVPYRSHICAELKNIPLAVFGNQIPFVSLYVHETDYITRNDALRKLAQYARFNSDEYEIEVSGHDDFWIVAQQSSFLDYVRDLQRTVGRNWNVLPSDKLRIFENDATETPISLTRADIAENTIKFFQADPRSIPAIRNLGFIDTGRDNDYNKVKATRARFPIALTAAEDSEDLDIPIGMEAIDAKQIVNKSLLIDDIARDLFSCTVLPHKRGLQPGDIIAPDVDSEIEFATGRIISVARNTADWTSDIVAERIHLSQLVTGPVITSNGGGATASISVDEEDGVTVTTITATNADEEGAFSIIGGADAALFDIDADTGVLDFLAEPDFEDPQDTDSNNVYEVIVQVTGNGLTDTQTITITVLDVDDTAPTITSSDTASVAENATLAKSLTSNESVTWSIVGGADQAQFEISGSTLRWAGDGTKDYEAPDDADTDNDYVVTVRATDTSSNYSEQTITVTVTDVSEGGSSGLLIGFPFPITQA